MPFLNIFTVPKEITQEQLMNDLSQFGKINSISLTKDKDNSNVNFGSIDFIELNKEEELFDYFKNYNLSHTKIKESRNNKKTYTKKPLQNESIPISNIKNPSYNFYKDDSFGKNITEFIWTDSYNDLFKIKDADDSLKLTTTYPGLLIGSGYNHPVVKSDNKQDKDAYQLGFFFDHTTGLPLITGSSIKGVLHHIAKNHDVICSLYDKTSKEAETFEELFEDHKTVFYDAYIIGTNNKGKIFGSDYITTHHPEEEMGQFMDPTPIKFLKILPEVTWQFQFKIDDKYIELIKSIILDFGLGAKTNVGYGQFKEK